MNEMENKNKELLEEAREVSPDAVQEQNSQAEKTQVETLEILPLLPMRGLVLFPRMVLHFDAGRKRSIEAVNAAMEGNQRLFLTAQKDLQVEDPAVKDLYQVGVVAKVRQVIRSGDMIRVLVEGLYRARFEELVQKEPYLTVTSREYPTRPAAQRKTMMAQALMRSIKSLFEEYASLMPKMPKEIMVTAMTAEDPDYLVEYIICNIPIEYTQKQSVLEESDLRRRMEMTAQILEQETALLDLERGIYEKVKESMDQNQREYYLREQMRAISQELGEEENPQDEAAQYREKILALHLEEETQEKLLKEADRLSKMPPSSQESSVIRSYLDIVLDLPWNTVTKDKIELSKAQRQLDRDHYGLQEVKKRILEFLAVRKLTDDTSGQILCLVGPPGVGKTSIARSVAQAMGRNFTRISLGGVRDESDIRGHRKTYIGAMPGRIINAVRQAKSKNPLILLDEIDKMGNDFRGDPASAMLEVLDSEQNHAFRDHYVEVPFDLSHVLFLTTANTLDTIPAPLRDRMEIIELGSYTREEKFQIAKRHLVQKQMKKHGLGARQLRVADDALYSLVDFYTREAGVRSLERNIAALCRKGAKAIVSGDCKRFNVTAQDLEELLGPKKFLPEQGSQTDEVGLVNGLAWTSVGGEMLQVEVAVLEGSGKIQLTGSLGDVMKESAQIAVSYVRFRARDWGIDPKFYENRDLHIHFPEGAVPKDGPSAGVTITTALVSALTGIPVRHDVAMTGEVSLRGRVLPIGGLKEKTMAAYRAGMKTVIIPKLNEPDLAQVDEVVKKAVTFVAAQDIEKVLQTALTQVPGAKPVPRPRGEKKLTLDCPIPSIPQQPAPVIRQ